MFQRPVGGILDLKNFIIEIFFSAKICFFPKLIVWSRFTNRGLVSFFSPKGFRFPLYIFIFFSSMESDPTNLIRTHVLNLYSRRKEYKNVSFPILSNIKQKNIEYDVTTPYYCYYTRSI